MGIIGTIGIMKLSNKAPLSFFVVIMDIYFR